MNDGHHYSGGQLQITFEKIKISNKPALAYPRLISNHNIET